MQTTKLSFEIPLAYVWDEKGRPGDCARITLKPVGGEFDAEPVAAVVRSSAPSDVQWRVSYEGVLQVQVELLSGTATSRATINLPAKAHAFDIAGSPAGQQRVVLLRGALRINLEAVRVQLENLLHRLWPTGRSEDIHAFHIEPAGLYVEGTLPEAAFAPGTASRLVVLRPPQHKRDVLGGKRFWSLEDHHFGRNDTLTSALAFIRSYADAIKAREEAVNGNSFIDNASYLPQKASLVRIFSEFKNGSTSIRWVAPDLAGGLRVQLKGSSDSEVAFFPACMEGRVVDNQRDPVPLDFIADNFFDETSQVVLYHYDLDEEGLPEFSQRTQLRKSLTIDQPQTANLTLQALSVPGENVLRKRVSADEEEGEKETIVERKRSWLCTDSGWMALEGVDQTPKLLESLERAAAWRGVFEAGQAGQENFNVQAMALSQTGIVLGLNVEGEEDIRLLLDNPMITVSTPQVWHAMPPAPGRESLATSSSTRLVGDPNSVVTAAITPEDPTPADALSNLQVRPPSLIAWSDAAGEDLKSRMAAVLDKATFISTNVIAPLGQAGSNEAEEGQLITAELEDGGSGEEFVLRLNAECAYLWQSLPNVPLTQSHSYSIEKDGRDYLEGNRGLLPFQLAPAVVQVGFAKEKLPWVVNSPGWAEGPRLALNGWSVPEKLAGVRFYLPTLPGIEATLDASDLTWVYRHGVPALDEAFGEVSEESKEEVEDAGGDPRRPDFSRVQDAEAFQIHPQQSQHAAGWRPGDTLSISEMTFDPRGDRPQLHVTLNKTELGAEAAEKISFSRNDHVEGANLDVKVSRRGNADGIAKIRHGGQPLIVYENGGTLESVDGLGAWRQEVSDRETHVNGRRLISGSFALSENDDKLHLELFGVLIDADSDPSEFGVQRWFLHDGSGGWPKLRGWPVYPLNLAINTKDGDVDRLSCTLDVIALYQEGEDGLVSNLPDTAAGSLSLVCELQPESGTLLLKSCSGTVDWRFTGDERGGIALSRLWSNIDGIEQLGVDDAPAAVSLFFRLPLGVFAVKVDAFNLRLGGDVSRQGEAFICDVSLAGIDEGYAVQKAELRWRHRIKPNVDNGLQVEIVQNITPERSSWQLFFGHPGQPVGPFVIEPYPIDRHRAFFKVLSVEQVELGWLHAQSATGLLAVTFSRDAQNMIIKEIDAEIRMLLADRTEGKTRLAAVLGIQQDWEAADETAGKILVVDISGRWYLENDIKYSVPGVEGAFFTHQAELLFDRARVPAEAILLNQLSDEYFAAAIVKHKVILDPENTKKERTWTAAQMVRFTNARSIAEMYRIEADLDAVEGDRMAIDGSAVFWLQPSAHDEQKDMSRTAPAVANDQFSIHLRRRPPDYFYQGEEYHALRLPLVAGSFNDELAGKLAVELNEENRQLTYAVPGVQPLGDPPPQRSQTAIETAPYKIVEGDTLWDISRSFDIPIEDLLAVNLSIKKPELIIAGNILQIPIVGTYTVRKGDSVARVAIKYYGVEKEIRGRERILRIETNKKAIHPGDLLKIPGIGDVRPPSAERRLQFFRLGEFATYSEAAQLQSLLRLEAGSSAFEGVMPAYGGANGNEVLVALPLAGAATSNDVQWMEKDFEGKRHLAAATLTYQQVKAGKALRGPALFVLPFDASFNEESPIQKKTTNFQLIVYERGKLRLAAQVNIVLEETFEKEEMAKEWARTELSARRRVEAACVLIDYAELEIVQRSTEHLFVELPPGDDWHLTGDVEQEDQMVVDPRLSVASLGSFAPNPQEGDPIVELKAEENLALRIFGAAPAVSPDRGEDETKSDEYMPRNPAATRFRLAPIAIVAADNRQGELAVPITGRGERSGGALQGPIITQWDEVPFAVYDEQGTKHRYPRPRRGPWIGSRVRRNANNASQGIVPPLVDVVSWAARPGEMVRSNWMLSRLAVKSAGETGLVASGRHPSGVSLRRPRAAAGSVERVELRTLPRNGGPVDDRFSEEAFELRQTLDESWVPEQGIGIALTTKDAVYFDGQEATNPARLFYEEAGSETLVEEFQLYLLGERPSPGAASKTSGTRRMLIWTRGAETTLTLVEGTISIKDPGGILIEDLHEGSWIGGKCKLGSLAMTKLGDIVAEIIASGSDAKEIYLKIVEPEVNVEDKSIKTPDSSSVMKITFLKKSGQFVPPPLVTALLATADEETMVAGYGRLKPEQFSLVEPLPFVFKQRTDGEEKERKGLRWQRTARLKALHRRKSPATSYEYDVVVYGPGGELIRTAQLDEMGGGHDR